MFLNNGFMSNCPEVEPKPSVELLFSKALLVAINDRGSSIPRSSKLYITVERTSNLSPLRKELVVRLTDEYEPFFIYILNLNEEDFHQLKLQQGLLIDFPSFPQKFIGLLEQCLKEEHKETPKFLLNLKIYGDLGCEINGINLDIIETNPFKHLTHLSLKLSPASDTFVKKFLASTLKSFKDEKERLENAVKVAQSEYQNHLHHCQENMSTRNQEFERIRQSLQNEISSLNRRYSDELRSEQQKLLTVQKEAELSREKLKIGIEACHQREKESLEEKVKQLELQNKELQSKLINAESQTRDIRSHFVNNEDELFQLRQKNATLTKENKSLDAQFHEHLKMIGTLKSQLAGTTQELRDKELIFIKTQELLKTTQDQKKQLEELLDQKQALVAKRENALRSVSDDLNKGNEIIKKLQNEIRSYHTKLKIHGDVACKQEEAILEKEKLAALMEKDLKSKDNLLQQKESELGDTRKELNLTKEKLEEAQKHNKTNENVISWLNKQLNENGIQKRGFVSGITTDPLKNVSSIPFRHTAMTSTPSIPQSVLYQARVPTLSGSPICTSNVPFTSIPSYFQSRVPLNSQSTEDQNRNNAPEPDPIIPPTAMTASNTAVKQISSKTPRSSFPPQRSSRVTGSKTPPISNKSK